MKSLPELSLPVLGGFFHGAPELRVEWSLRVAETGLTERNRLTFWIGPELEGPDRFPSIGRMLEAIAAPWEVRERQQALAEDCVWQGFATAVGAVDGEHCLYLHHRDRRTGKIEYAAYTWGAVSTVEVSHYSFHFLPCTPEGTTPAEYCHPGLTGVLARLLENERLFSSSGFWLRQRCSQIDQVDLAYPWHPPLSLLLAAVQETAFGSAAICDQLMAYQSQPIRHIALSGKGSPEPALTIYFSAPLTGAWPVNIHDLHDAVHHAGTALHQTLEEHFFNRIPSVAVAPTGDLDAFYSTDSVATWQQVLGAEMHYHFGLFSQEERESPPDIASDVPFARAVTQLFDFIPSGSSVYDLGCGWGGPARMLTRDHHCRVLGMTISKTQYRHLAAAGLPVRYGDLETTLPPGHFDCMLLLESLEHVRDKARLLQILRLFGSRLVMRVHCQDGAPNSVNFAGTMPMIQSTQLREIIEAAGWQIIHWQNRREESMPSLRVWHERLAAIAPGTDLHLETFRAFCARICQCEQMWAGNNQLIEVVAV